MSATGAWLEHDRGRLAIALWPACGTAALLVFAAGMAAALYRYPPSLALVLAGGLGLGMLALALARYDAAVAIGFLLIGVVKVEPAPTDAVFALLIALAVATGRFSLGRLPPAALALLGGFLALNVLSAVAAVAPAAAAKFFAITLYLAVFAVWLASYVDSARRARWVALAYTAAAVASALLGTLALFLPIPARGLFLTSDGLRAQALFEDPNVFGPFLVPAALVLIEEILRPRLLRQRSVIKIVLLMALVTGLVFSYSRAAWLNFAVAVGVVLAVLALRRGGARRAMALVVTLLIAAAGLAGAITVTGSSGFLRERAALQSYDTERFGAQRAGLRLAEEQPLGIGPGQFELVSPVATHSTYARALAEQGALGFIALLGFVLATLASAARNAVLGRDSHGIGSAALLGSWCGLMANSLFVDTLHWRHLWVVAALVFAGATRARR